MHYIQVIAIFAEDNFPMAIVVSIKENLDKCNVYKTVHIQIALSIS